MDEAEKHQRIIDELGKKSFGIDANGLIEFTKSQSEEFPFEMGSLERECLTHLGDWRTAAHPQYGFFYRFAVKQGIVDSEGDPITAFLHFIVPYHHKDHEMKPDEYESIRTRIHLMLELSTKQYAQYYDKVASAVVGTPAYMLEELAGLMPNMKFE